VGLLDDLKKQADALKAQDTDKTESLRSTAVSVDHSLRRTFLYLNALGKQLNVVQMPSPFVFDLPTVGIIDGLIIKDFFCDFRSKHFIDKDYYGEVHVAYRCWSDKVLTIKKGPFFHHTNESFALFKQRIATGTPCNFKLLVILQLNWKFDKPLGAPCRLMTNDVGYHAMLSSVNEKKGDCVMFVYMPPPEKDVVRYKLDKISVANEDA